MKNPILIAALILFVSTSFGPVHALEMGNKRKGKYTYRKVYKTCMTRGEVDAPKPVVNPDAHTQAEWTGIFEQKDFAEFKCGQEWATLSEEELTDIYTYLYSFAADSPTPAKCK